MKYKYSILSFIFGKGYEILHEVENPSPDVEHILVTDDDTLTSSTWKIIVDHDLDNKSPFEKCFTVRYNVFKYCSTDTCITIDGSIQVNRDPDKLIDIFNEKQSDICLMPHPLWSDFQTEYSAWIKMRKYPIERAKNFFNFLDKAHYNIKYQGLFQLCFSIKRRTKITSDIDSMTFALIKYLSSETEFERLDQTIFSFVMNRYFNHINVLPVSEQVVRSDYLTWYWHNSNKPNMNIFYDINKPDYKYVFNQMVECLYLK